MCFLALAGVNNTTASDNEIIIGMSAAFSGPSRSLGVELYRGSRAYFDQVNHAGGVHGRKLVLRAYDDAYDPVLAIRNTQRLVEQDQVFLLFNYVGTPTTIRILPLIKQYAEMPILLFFPFTGAEPQRRPPYSEYVFNLRSSYHNETRALVNRLADLGHQRIGVFYQADAYGRGGWEGVRNALRDRGMDIHAEATYTRGHDFSGSLASQVAIFNNTDTQAVISVCAYAACAAFIRDARDAGLDIPIANLSFSGSEAMAELLGPLSSSPDSPYTRSLITSQVVPSYLDEDLPAIAEYRSAMQAIGKLVPEGVDDDYQPSALSFTSLEGYLNARLLVAILEQLGPEPTRAGLRDAAESLETIDLGIGVTGSLGVDHHQALDAVFMTTLRDGVFIPLQDWREFEPAAP